MQITISLTNLLLVLIGISQIAIMVYLGRLIDHLKPRYNSKEGQKVIEAYETPKFGLGSVLALTDLEKDLISELGRVQAEKQERIERLQDQLEKAQAIATTGATRGKREK